SFNEKVRLFSNNYLQCFIYITSLESSQHVFTKYLYSKLISTSQLLEDFLDFHGAKNSKHWYFYRELSAAVRHLSLGGYSGQHILNRLIFYGISEIEDFEREMKITQSFIKASIIKMAPIILDEAKQLKIPIPKRGYSPSDFPGVSTSEMLDYDIDDVDKDLQKENIVKISSEFLSIARNFDQLGFYKPYDMKGIEALVPEKVNEVVIRQFEMLVHNLQSSFDTYVIHGGYRFGNRKLKQLRGYFSLVFHLLQMIGRLLHFYERHLHDAGYKNVYKKVREKLVFLIDPNVHLDRTINCCLFYTFHFLNSGKELAKEILNENIERSSVTVGVPVSLGFHARPSLLVAKIVQHFGGQVELYVADDRFDASSVLDIQWAGGKIQKENITEVIFKGDVRALKDIEILAGVNYGEDSIGKGVPLPSELAYLK
ncbi:MAG: HPr family phosphocarrier protein, partial [Desulfobacterales bacterium]